MSKSKAVQVRLDKELYKDAKVGLVKIDMSMQEFLEAYIQQKFGKERKKYEQKK